MIHLIYQGYPTVCVAVDQCVDDSWCSARNNESIFGAVVSRCLSICLSRRCARGPNFNGSMNMARPKTKPTVIGLLGGIAAGKSYAADLLRQAGAKLIDADAIGHEVLSQPLLVRRLTQEFGKEILMDGDAVAVIDRRKLAELVFGADAESVARRESLETILHPLIHAEAIRKLRGFKEQLDPPEAVVVDAPLLLEANWAPMCDLILFIDSDYERRLARALERGWTKDQFDSREDAQLDLDEKRRAATHILKNNDADELQKDIQDFWRKL